MFDIKNKINNIIIISIMVAIIESAKISLSFLPNIELVTPLIIIFTLKFERKVYVSVVIFVIIEGLLFGFGIWWIMYIYTWSLLVSITLLLKNNKSRMTYSLLSGIFGLMYGGLCSIVYIFISGVNTAFVWWIAGIPFDIIHCISNFILMFVLYKPLCRTVKYL